MKPVKQTEDKSCLCACLASILELPLDIVPDLPEDETWIDELNKWLVNYGLQFITINYFSARDDAFLKHFGWTILSGMSPRSNTISHAVVGWASKPHFDPHPDNTFFGGNPIERFGIFVPRYPEQYKLVIQPDSTTV
jgi:hypothetical protein